MPIARPSNGAVGRFVRTRFSGQVAKAYFNGGLHKLGFVLHLPEADLQYTYGISNPVLSINLPKLNTLLACVRYLATGDGMKWLHSCGCIGHILVHGDSQLVIKFINKMNMPEIPAFVMLVVETLAYVLSLLVLVKFVHIAWAQNELADHVGI